MTRHELCDEMIALSNEAAESGFKATSATLKILAAALLSRADFRFLEHCIPWSREQLAKLKEIRATREKHTEN